MVVVDTEWRVEHRWEFGIVGSLGVAGVWATSAERCAPFAPCATLQRLARPTARPCSQFVCVSLLCEKNHGELPNFELEDKH
jgi:hypothetical protein